MADYIVPSKQKLPPRQLSGWGVPMGPGQGEGGPLPLSMVPMNPNYQPDEPLPNQTSLTALASQPDTSAPSGPSKFPGFTPPKQDLGDIQKLLDQLKSGSTAALAQQQQGIGQQENQLQALAGMPTQTSIAPMLGLVDNLWGTHLSQSYKPPASPEERMQQMAQLQQGIQKAKFGLSETEAQTLKDVLSGQYHLSDIKERGRESDIKAQTLGVQREFLQGQKEDKLKNTFAMNLDQALDPNRSRNKNVSDAQAKVNQADHLQSMVGQFAEGNLPKANMEELATGLNTLVAGHTGASREAIKALVPETAMGSAKQLETWLTNEPQGLKQQAFVKLMMDSVVRQKAVAQGHVRQAQVNHLPAHAELKKMDPQLYQSIVDQYIKPEDAASTAAQITPEQAAAELARRRGNK